VREKTMDKMQLKNNQGKEILKRTIAKRLETKWNLAMAYPHLMNLNTGMLKDFQNFLDYKELTMDKDKSITSKSGYALQMIKTYKSIAKNELDN